ncbi:hypothetical protein CEUSTIGMA_g3323.t1 [Chlamydomonas eustigma]|uniref:Glycosyltransferase n=1 Tax=Chlamydomonas eustigma TaxID=1157962 RepID=A0A250WZE7_9CHLO|nr:hypothetical protein CEUSTIGMA_g3323.t1 [Chlamydomonas eustigma]|eukprot:GAX75880.1 hypothetical protein CEUSTIGMA_g3323.t1 [Chlamydomonas eustigma]
MHLTVLFFIQSILLFVTGTDTDCHDKDLKTRTPQQLETCITLDHVCIDQQQFVTYDTRYQPSLSIERPPTFSVKDITYNWPNPLGNGDRYLTGQQLHYAPIVIRPNTSQEACSDMRAMPPDFDACTVPLVMWSRWPFNIVEAFGTVYARLQRAIAGGDVSEGLLPVLATPHGLRAPRHLELFLEALFPQPMITLADLSKRPQDGSCSSLKAGTSTPTTSATTKNRCYRRVHLCRLRHRDETSPVKAARALAKHHAAAAAAAAQGSSAGLLDPWNAADRNKVLRVVIASRLSTESRSLLNEGELLRQCNEWKSSDVEGASTRRLASGNPPSPKRKIGSVDQLPHLSQVSRDKLTSSDPLVTSTISEEDMDLSDRNSESRRGAHEEVSNTPKLSTKDREYTKRHIMGRNVRSTGVPNKWHTARCVIRKFGSEEQGGLVADMEFMSHADVLLCLHGAACINAFFMANGSSLIEVRPLGMSAAWANQYFFRQLRREGLIHWYGIDVQNAINSKLSALEEQKSEVLNEQVRSRERHVRLPWGALKHHLDVIAKVNREHERYYQVYKTGHFYVTDDLQLVPHRPKSL